MSYVADIPEEFDERLTALSKRTRRSKEELVLQAFQEFLEDQENYYDALEVWKRVERNEEKLYTRSELKKDLASSKRKNA
ncbi:MAG: hypothetical protein WCG05_04305 [Alphaproteobacteria bacterium]